MTRQPGSDRIFLLQGGTLAAMTEKPYDSEAVLQGFLADYPDLLAGSQVNPEEPRRWLLVDRELGVPGEVGGADRWAVDHLFIDQDAVPTLVEVKRSTNTQIRREVVGQLLDYAANAVRFWPVERLRRAVEERDPGTVADFLGEDGDPEAFWETVASNLEAGHLRLMIVADRLPDELVRIIEYLNDQMPDTEVAGVEVGHYVHGDTKVFVPRLVGVSATQRQRRAKPASSFDEDLALAPDVVRQADAHLVEWAENNGWNARVTRVSRQVEKDGRVLAQMTPKWGTVQFGVGQLLDKAIPGAAEWLADLRGLTSHPLTDRSAQFPSEDLCKHWSLFDSDLLPRRAAQLQAESALDASLTDDHDTA